MADPLTGLFEGFLGRRREVEQRNFELGQQQTAQEGAIFQHLMGSDDPQIRTLALTGLLDTANPRRKAGGLKGWIGETQSSPYLAQMQQLINTPVTSANPAAGAVPPGAQLPGGQTLPSTQMAGGVTLPHVQPSITETPESTPAAMPAGSPVAPAGSRSAGATSGVGAPPTPTSYTQSPPVPQTISRMRNVFLTGADKVKADRIATESGNVEGEVAGLVASGFSQAEARAMIKSKMDRQYAGAHPQSVSGEMPDGSGGWSPAFGVFTNGQYVHPETGQPLAGFRPRTAGINSSAGVAIEPLARVMYGRRYAELNQQEAGNVYEASVLQKSALTVPQSLQAVERLIPNGTVEQKMQLADALRQGTAAPVTPQGAAAGGPPAPTTAPTPGAPPPGTSTTPVVAPAAGAPASGPPKSGTLAGAVPTNFNAANHETGKAPSAAVQQAVARTTQMNDVIDRALSALEPYKQSTSLDDTAKLVEHYRQGTEGDPFALAAAQLPDLAGLQQSAAATLGGTSRSQRVYADKRQHVPRLPSGRQVMFSEHVPGLNAGRVNAASQLLKGDEGGFDSPAQMYLKLKGLKDANDAFLRDMTSAAQMQLNPIAPAATPAGGPPSPTTIGTPGQAFQDPKTGQWMIP